MSKTLTLEIPQSEWDKFQKELIRAIAVLQEQQRESEERWTQISELKAETAQLREELQRRLQDVDKHLGSPETNRQSR